MKKRNHQATLQINGCGNSQCKQRSRNYSCTKHHVRNTRDLSIAQLNVALANHPLQVEGLRTEHSGDIKKWRNLGFLGDPETRKAERKRWNQSWIVYHSLYPSDCSAELPPCFPM